MILERQKVSKKNYNNKPLKHFCESFLQKTVHQPSLEIRIQIKNYQAINKSLNQVNE